MSWSGVVSGDGGDGGDVEKVYPVRRRASNSGANGVCEECGKGDRARVERNLLIARVLPGWAGV
jgi:hypothetical protein